MNLFKMCLLYGFRVSTRGREEGYSVNAIQSAGNVGYNSQLEDEGRRDREADKQAIIMSSSSSSFILKNVPFSTLS